MSEHDGVVDEIAAGGSKCSRAYDSASSNAFASFRSTGELQVAQACSRAKSRSRVLGSMAVATMLTMAQPKM